MKYSEHTLGELCIGSKGRYGIGASAEPYGTTKYTYLRITDINDDGTLNTADLKSLNDPDAEKYLLSPGDIVFARTGASTGRSYYYEGTIPNMVFAGFLIKFTPDETKVYPKFLKYYCISNKYRNWINGALTGSTRGNINEQTLRDMPVILPDLETQKKIVRILSALDQKIELNNQQNETLFELGRQLYIEKFENNQTIDKVELGNFFPVITGKKDANASSENGKYPFFTCSKTISKIDDYVFDASAILLAGNGDFNVKFYRGKFDAYQRTYVLIPNNPEYLGFLYWAISYNLPTITANYRGSVIKFITKGNIESFKVPFVDNKYIPTFMKYLEKIEKNNQQNEVLAGLRDVLLPKLMSGEINLNEITINE